MVVTAFRVGTLTDYADSAPPKDAGIALLQGLRSRCAKGPGAAMAASASNTAPLRRESARFVLLL